MKETKFYIYAIDRNESKRLDINGTEIALDAKDEPQVNMWYSFGAASVAAFEASKKRGDRDLVIAQSHETERVKSTSLHSQIAMLRGALAQATAPVVRATLQAQIEKLVAQAKAQTGSGKEVELSPDLAAAIANATPDPTVTATVEKPFQIGA